MRSKSKPGGEEGRVGPPEGGRGGAGLPRDLLLLFITRGVRMFGYGLLSVVLILYLTSLGFGTGTVGLLLSLALLGDALISLLLTTRADSWGRRRVLFLGALLMLVAGLPIALSSSLPLVLLALTIGVISPSGNEVGPFLAVEQASLSELLRSEDRTGVFAWYNLTGSFAGAAGALAGGWTAQALQGAGLGAAGSYRALVLAYAGLGLLLALLFPRLSPKVEARPGGAPTGRLGLGESGRVVRRLAALFSLDAFGGGFVIQSAVAYWFHLRYGLGPGLLGSLFFGANLLAGLSALVAASLAKRFGLLNTMVFTHLPSNVLLILVPLMPSLPLALGLLLARFAISQMDVPTRQAYTMAVVSPAERSAAAGLTGIARSGGAALSPALAGPLLANPALAGAIFLLAGGTKILYDLLLFRAFRRAKVEGLGS